MMLRPDTQMLRENAQNGTQKCLSAINQSIIETYSLQQIETQIVGNVLYIFSFVTIFVSYQIKN
jgi:hypothetical protein